VHCRRRQHVGAGQTLLVFDALGHPSSATRLVLAGASQGLSSRAGPVACETWPEPAVVFAISPLPWIVDCQSTLDNTGSQWCAASSTPYRRHSAQRPRPSSRAGFDHGRAAEKATGGWAKGRGRPTEARGDGHGYRFRRAQPPSFRCRGGGAAAIQSCTYI
jgi:hypothetical protein